MEILIVKISIKLLFNHIRAVILVELYKIAKLVLKMMYITLQTVLNAIVLIINNFTRQMMGNHVDLALKYIKIVKLV